MTIISGSSAFVRENLSPFTKDFRAEDHTMSVYSFFEIPSKERDQNLEKMKNGVITIVQSPRQRLQNERLSSRAV